MPYSFSDKKHLDFADVAEQARNYLIRQFIKNHKPPSDSLVIRTATLGDLADWGNWPRPQGPAFMWGQFEPLVEAQQQGMELGDQLVAIRDQNILCGLTYFKRDKDRIHIIQTESRSDTHPLRGDISYINLQLAMTFAKMAGNQTIELRGPFYLTERQMQRQIALGFKPMEGSKNMMAVFPPYASALRYDTYRGLSTSSTAAPSADL